MCATVHHVQKSSNKNHLSDSLQMELLCTFEKMVCDGTNELIKDEMNV